MRSRLNGDTKKLGERPRVALAGRGEPAAVLNRALELEGSFAGLASRAARVLVKPNITYPRPSGSGAVTDNRVIDALLAALRDAGAGKIVIADGPGKSDASDGFREAGYTGFAAKYDVQFVDLNSARTRTIEVPSPRAMPKLEIPEIVLDADLFITITPPKTHVDGILTLNAKNLFGVPPTRFYGSPRALLHLYGVNESVHDICRAAPPDYAIADAMVAMELGVARGRAVDIGAIVAGANLVATDAVTAHLIGQDPAACPYLVFLSEDGEGPLDLESIDLVGDSLDELRVPLRLTHEKSPRDWADGEPFNWDE